MESQLWRRRGLLGVLLVALAATGSPARADQAGGFVVEVLVDGRPLPEYPHGGLRYLEATAGEEYAIRLRNPLGVRVAVALSVDGLNTIDARRTTAANASKWVLEPYETVTISGWQTDRAHARRFYFTSEERSYAQWLGKTENVGVIAAVFFRERAPAITMVPSPPAEAGGAARSNREAPRPAKGADRAGSPAPGSAPAEQSADEKLAATGIGDRVDHRVEQVHLDLETAPVATMALHYEFRPQLVRLGILPAQPDTDRLARRSRAKGFEPGFCPEPR